MMLHSLITTVLVFTGLFATSAALAETLQCDQKQTFCLTSNRRLVVGDAVGIFNADKELVATGEVVSMRAAKRKIEINKRLGAIRKGDKVRRLETDVSADPTQAFPVYKEPARIVGGAAAGLTRINLAENTSAYSAGGFGQYRWRKNIQLVARAHFFTASGIAVDTSNGDEEEAFSAQGLTLLPGLAYEIFAKRTWSLRGEAGIGASFVSLNTSGNASPKSLEKVNSGVGLGARLGTSVLYNRLGDWHPEMAFEFMKIHDSRATTVAFGIMREIR